ncbi:MAG: hypothetical protein GKR89_15550 [Candidatus Latescibacteria bacterium]|nr:hypothetical protein [Candidatus Latescibacterota bacterium]
MTADPNFDLAQAHRYFSASCFNSAWDLIDKTDRTPAEDEQMIRLNQTSIWHWTQRQDCTDQTMSVGYWQAARIYALLGRSAQARHYGQLCLQHSREEPPFFLAYAYEALARAEQTAGAVNKAEEYRAEAAWIAEKITDADSKKQLLDDLQTITT